MNVNKNIDNIRVNLLIVSISIFINYAIDAYIEFGIVGGTCYLIGTTLAICFSILLTDKWIST